MTSVLTDATSVWPWGLARAPCWLPILPLAPAPFSTTTGWPSVGDSRSATKRAMMSGPVPGVNGTTNLIGWSGQPKALFKVRGATARPAMVSGNWRRRMNPLKQPLGDPSIQLIRDLLVLSSFYNCSRRISGDRHAGKDSDRFVPGDRRRAGRRAGAGGAGPTRLRHGWAGRQGGGRKPRAGAGVVPRAGPGAAAAAHHRQPLAGRPRQGGQPLRPAHRARPVGRHGRDSARKHRALRRVGRTGARRLAVPRAGRAAGGHRRPGGGAWRDLPLGVRRRSGLGWLRCP